MVATWHLKLAAVKSNKIYMIKVALGIQQGIKIAELKGNEYTFRGGNCPNCFIFLLKRVQF